MASRISNVNLLQTIAKRSYAAAPQPAACIGKLEVSTLSNKAKVTSLGCGPKSLVKVAVGFRAGSRYENSDNFGASHLLRCSAGLSTGCSSGFAIQRNLQQIGANLTAVQDRETLVYILEASCNNISAGLDFLRLAITNQEFRAWELADNIPKILAELHIIPPQVRVLDSIHLAAFRSGLGNPLIATKGQVKKLGSETLQHYACSNLVGDRAAIAACGLPHKQLQDFAESLDISQGSGKSDPASKYFGGEIRVDKDLPLVHTVIAGEAPGLNSSEVLASAVAKYALGAGPAVKYGLGSGPLAKLSGPCSAASAFSVAHSDAGLLGVYVAASPSEARKAVEEASKVLKAGVSDQDIERGKNLLASAILFSYDTCQGVVDDLTGQSLLTSGPKIPTQLVEEVSKVSSQQVKQVIQKANSRRSLAVLGKTSSVPYLDEL